MKLHDTGVYLVHGVPQAEAPAGFTQEQAKQGTIAYGILKAHNTGDSMQDLRMKFDSMTSHDITYVGIIQTARASGMKEFPLPYVMTNCHNSLCAVGGTINEDDHQFALSAAHKYGGIYVPPNMAVIHSYNREMMSGCGRMILGSDSHTRYGALGTMAVGEGGGELAKQLVGRTYDMTYPGVVAIYLTGKPNPGVGPHDVALALVAATYAPVGSDGLVQCAVGQVRVQPQPRHRRRHRRRHTGRGRVWVFVGVELDKVVDFQLLAGHIRLQCSQRFSKIAAHGLTPPFARPQTGWSRSWRGRAGPRARQSWRCGPGPRPGLRGCSR